MGWIGINFDGTLATGSVTDKLGKPVAEMVMQVQEMLNAGKDVRIFTARAHPPGEASAESVAAIKKWCVKYLGQELPVTCMKDGNMDAIYDWRCVFVEYIE